MHKFLTYSSYTYTLCVLNDISEKLRLKLQQLYTKYYTIIIYSTYKLTY